MYIVGCTGVYIPSVQGVQCVQGCTFAPVQGCTFDPVQGCTFASVLGFTFVPVRGCTFVPVRGCTCVCVHGGTVCRVRYNVGCIVYTCLCVSRIQHVVYSDYSFFYTLYALPGLMKYIPIALALLVLSLADLCPILLCAVRLRLRCPFVLVLALALAAHTRAHYIASDANRRDLSRFKRLPYTWPSLPRLERLKTLLFAPN